jgi:hypothetical protein
MGLGPTQEETQEMNPMKNIKLSPVHWLALGLIVAGLAIMIPRAQGMLSFYREARYAAEHDFASGNPSPSLIRPWMSIRYISAAYAVPQKYLFDAAHIQPRKETSMVALSRLNQEMGLGKEGEEPALVKTIRAAILAYRIDPVHPGLLEKRVEGWMTMQYIANSTGIAVEELFAAAHISSEGNAYKPLDFLSDELDYPGGVKALLEVLQEKVQEQEGQP